MAGMIIGAIAALIVIFLLVIIIRTLRFKPYPETEAQTGEIKVDEEKIVSDMVSLIQCRTVSYRDPDLIDEAEFEKLRRLLAERFPVVHERCRLYHIGKNGLLYFLKGKSDKEPSVCMAHYDVVPVNEDEWDVPAFDGLIKDGCIWGRGTLDTKGTLCSILEAAEQLLKEGFVPENDMYFSFSGEEEIDGQSCGDIVTWLEEHGVKPAIVLDEGGAVVEGAFPGVSGEMALIGIGEKGSVSVDVEISGIGGHASSPPKKTTLGYLSEAVCKIESSPFPRHFTKPVKEMFDIVGRHSTFGMRLIFANLWCFLPLLDLICKKSGGELNAMMRTTAAVTRFKGSDAYNVMPSSAKFGVNLRVMSGDTIDSSIEYLNKVIDNDKIKIDLVGGMNPSIYSDTSCAQWEYLKKTIHDTWPDAIVSPYLMMACSDSRHYCRITDKVYRFSCMKLSKEERGMIHGNNERIPIATLLKTVQFYVRFIRGL